MQAIQQIDFKGIDTLKINEIETPKLSTDGVMIKMNTWPVVPSDWKKETNPDATAESFDKLPRTIGAGGVGRVTQVGSQRDQSLLNQRVLVLQPTGAYSTYIENRNSDWLFPLPDNVSNNAAATLLAGAGTALMLKREIKKCYTDQALIITGANSVIGSFLLQLLSADVSKIYPVVSPASYHYLKELLPQITPVTLDELPNLDKALIIDIAGSEKLLQAIADKVDNRQFLSVALMHTSLPFEIKFVHEEFNPEDYRDLIHELNTQHLTAPIGKSFDFSNTIEAQHYAKEHHSRGRVLVKLNQ